MKSHFQLLQIDLHFQDYKFAILCFITAFVVTMLCIPVIIKLAKKYNLYDMPNERKEHTVPDPYDGWYCCSSRHDDGTFHVAAFPLRS